MKTVGIIGGIGPESTIEYYRFIIAGYRARTNDDSYPAIIINSVDLSKLVGWMNANELDAVTNYLVAAIERLARAGADFAAMAANTPHIVFDQVSERSPLPMISFGGNSLVTTLALMGMLMNVSENGGAGCRISDTGFRISDGR